MRYWDASALVPLIVAEPASEALRAIAREQEIVTWCLSPVEITSALARRAREGALAEGDRRAALVNLADLAESWVEITSMAPVRERACRLLGVHPLRAADALQLAAALLAVAERPTGHDFICTDRRLREAASREGFRILPLDAP
jgi:predicted nucleic acid-binding protein